MSSFIERGARYLVTTDSWFVAPDGEQYRAAWGRAEIIKIEDVFGFTPLRPSTNWFLRVGKGNLSVLIAGCQIYYVVRSNDPPTRIVGTYKKEYGPELPINKIYFAQ